MTEYYIAFTMGLLGSLHCLGMCGPIALALPRVGEGQWGRWAGGLVYNAGRITTYMVLGVIAGVLGGGLVYFGAQQVISIVVGGLILMAAILPFLFKRLNIGAWLVQGTGRLKKAFAPFFAKRSFGSLWAIGQLNGLLPCGLVYMAVGGSLVTGRYDQGLIFMFFFGLGTLPMMLGMVLLGGDVKTALMRRFSKSIPVFLAMIGLLFILRGMGLGIPYVSPAISLEGDGAVECIDPVP